MFLDYTPEQQALRAELREYFRTLLTPEVRASSSAGPTRTVRSTARWSGRWAATAGSDWAGRRSTAARAGRRSTSTSSSTRCSGPARRSRSSPSTPSGRPSSGSAPRSRSATYLPGILSGDILFAIGYTEPEAGTDLASLATRAVLDGDEWVINGNKVFTSGANQADYIWLACRTDPDAPKHRGISIIIVPTSSPGYHCTPIATSGSTHTNATYYQDVRVPRSQVVGEVNEGWTSITSQLGHERVGLAAFGGRTEQSVERRRDWCRQLPAGEGRVIDQEWVRQDLAEPTSRSRRCGC